MVLQIIQFYFIYVKHKIPVCKTINSTSAKCEKKIKIKNTMSQQDTQAQQY